MYFLSVLLSSFLLSLPLSSQSLQSELHGPSWFQEGEEIVIMTEGVEILRISLVRKGESNWSWLKVFFRPYLVNPKKMMTKYNDDKHLNIDKTLEFAVCFLIS